MQFHSLIQMCRNIRIKFLSCAYMDTTLTFLGKCVIQTNPSKFDEWLCSDIIVQITFETTNRNTWFYILWQGVPEDVSSVFLKVYFTTAVPHYWCKIDVRFYVSVVEEFSGMDVDDMLQLRKKEQFLFFVFVFLNL